MEVRKGLAKRCAICRDERKNAKVNLNVHRAGLSHEIYSKQLLRQEDVLGSEQVVAESSTSGGRLTTPSMAQVISMAFEHGLGQALITGLEARRLKEKEKIVQERVYGHRWC